MTIDEFNESFDMLLSYYPNTRVTEGLKNIYFLGLSELSSKEFNLAIGRIIKEYNGEFLPKVPVILKYSKNDNLENQIVLAKKLLKTTIIKHGNCGMICFEDKGLHAVVDYIGWNRICNMEEKDFENFLNFQFDGVYKTFLEKPFETSEYYIGTSKLFGQTQPFMITYKSIGINAENLKFIPLEYKPLSDTKKLDMSIMKNKMLVGG